LYEFWKFLEIEDTVMSLATNNWSQSGQIKEVKMIKNNLKNHKKIMDELIAKGMSREDASKQAMKDMKK
jgi:hypothetical protein